MLWLYDIPSYWLWANKLDRTESLCGRLCDLSKYCIVVHRIYIIKVMWFTPLAGVIDSTLLVLIIKISASSRVEGSMYTMCFVSFVVLGIKFAPKIQSIMSCETSLWPKCWPYILYQWEVIWVCWNWLFPLVFLTLAQYKGEWNFHQPHFGREKFHKSYFLSFPINIKNVDSVDYHFSICFAAVTSDHHKSISICLICR